MSTVHQSPYWPALLENSEKKNIESDGSILCTYRGRKLFVAATLMVGADMTNEILEMVSFSVKERIKAKAGSAIFYLNRF